MMALKKPTDEIALADLLSGLADVEASDNVSPRGINNDSRKISAGDLFLACRGFRANGAQFIDDAIASGACAVLVDAQLVRKNEKYSIPVISVKNLSNNAGLIAHRFYKEPSEYLNVIGITGTNGKTSTAHFIAEALSAATGKEAGLIGTLGIGTPSRLQTSKNTTPDALTIHHTLALMREQGTESVAMEVSSHALAQARVAGVNFDIGIFTNLSQDHLDYHGDMKAYAEAKRQLFLVETLQSAVINIDDDYGQQLKKELEGRLRIITYNTNQESDIGAAEEHVSATITKQQLGILSIELSSPWGRGSLNSKLTGDFNAGNLLASLSALCLSGVQFTEALNRLSKVAAIPGRMECFSKKGWPRVIVDYAHTPDALHKALITLRDITTGKLICVVGCGGDRDQGKRPLMGKIAETLSDQVILTNDNPRNEDPLSIIDQILSGMDKTESVRVVTDRSSAINEAISSAKVDDVILIAGKGHETWQEAGGIRLPFSDRQLVRNLLERAE
jgi:UDP-N-acetylmuramoyl-L-alanyl-D-glutamate--2,6-diaminopimelate ligase